MIKVFVACGSGIATSSVACETVANICKAANIDVELSKGSLMEIPSKQDVVDIVLTTAKFRGECKKPLISITSFITGIGEESTKEKVLAALKELEAEKEK